MSVDIMDSWDKITAGLLPQPGPRLNIQQDAPQEDPAKSWRSEVCS